VIHIVALWCVLPILLTSASVFVLLAGDYDVDIASRFLSALIFVMSIFGIYGVVYALGWVS